jgi:hypothetical protein
MFGSWMLLSGSPFVFIGPSAKACCHYQMEQARCTESDRGFPGKREQAVHSDMQRFFFLPQRTNIYSEV